jgi:hypothetical protein
MSDERSLPVLFLANNNPQNTYITSPVGSELQLVGEYQDALGNFFWLGVLQTIYISQQHHLLHRLTFQEMSMYPEQIPTTQYYPPWEYGRIKSVPRDS